MPWGMDVGLLVILSALVIGFSKQLSGLFVRAMMWRPLSELISDCQHRVLLNTVTNCYLGALNGMGKTLKEYVPDDHLLHRGSDPSVLFTLLCGLWDLTEFGCSIG